MVYSNDTYGVIIAIGIIAVVLIVFLIEDNS